MSQPVAYAPSTAFVTYQSTQPWFPGQNIDVELNNLKSTTDQVRANLALIQRDDGALVNGIVTAASLSVVLQTGGFSPLSAWVTGTAYTQYQTVVTNFNIYQCAVQHTAGNFATDLAAAKWTLLTALPAGPPGNATMSGVAVHGIPVVSGATSIGSSIALTSGQIIVGQTASDPLPATLGGDATLNNAGALTVTKTNGVSFAASATTDATNAGNLSTGTILAARMPAHTGDVTSSAGAVALTIAAAAVTYAKMQSVSATARFLGRKTALAGVVEELAAADVLSIIGAVKSDMQTATSTTLAVTPAVTQHHPGVAKATVYYTTVTTTAITSSYGVSSLTDNGVGDTTVNFSTAFASANYSVTAIAGTPGATLGFSNVRALATGSAEIGNYNTSSTLTDFSSCHAKFHGAQ